MPNQSIESHYGRGGILDAIVRALDLGKDPNALAPIDLAPVDEFHIRGRESTVELAGRVTPKAGEYVLDVGCGLGGSARYLAEEHGCTVEGIDLTDEYISAATELARRVGLSDKVSFRTASALDLPFENATFDLVWTEHTQMNIEDKDGFYSEIARVLKPGGRLAFHDIFAGVGGEPTFPVPWAEDASISSLWAVGRVQLALESVGFEVGDMADKSELSLEWFQRAAKRIAKTGPSPLGIHLLMGDTAATKLANMVRNLAENKIVAVQGTAAKV